MSFWNKIKALFSTAGVEMRAAADNTPLTHEQEQVIANSVEFSQLLQDEQATLIAAQNKKIDAMSATFSELSTQLIVLAARTEAAEKVAADAKAEAASAVALAAAVGSNAAAKTKEVAQEINKLKGAPMQAQEADKATEGAPEAAAPTDFKEAMYQNFLQFGGMSPTAAARAVYGTDAPPTKVKG
jgi:hypothetical protein